MGVCNCSMFRCMLLYAHSSFAIILMGKRELVALLSLSSWCLAIVVWAFLAVPWVSKVTWCINWRRLLALINFQRSSLIQFPIIKRLAITLMYCNRLHAWWSAQLQLATLFSSLIARWWVGLQTLWRFLLKDLSIDEMVGTLCFGSLSGPLGFSCWVSFASVFSFIYCWVLIFAWSPFYISIYMFWEMMHW